MSSHLSVDEYTLVQELIRKLPEADRALLERYIDERYDDGYDCGYDAAHLNFGSENY